MLTWRTHTPPLRYSQENVATAARVRCARGNDDEALWRHRNEDSSSLDFLYECSLAAPLFRCFFLLGLPTGRGDHRVSNVKWRSFLWYPTILSPVHEVWQIWAFSSELGTPNSNRSRTRDQSMMQRKNPYFWWSIKPLVTIMKPVLSYWYYLEHLNLSRMLVWHWNKCKALKSS